MQKKAHRTNYTFGFCRHIGTTKKNQKACPVFYIGKQFLGLAQLNKIPTVLSQFYEYIEKLLSTLATEKNNIHNEQN